MKKIITRGVHVLKTVGGKISSPLNKLKKRKITDEVEEKEDNRRSPRKFSIIGLLILLVALVQVVFAVMIYGFKREDIVTRTVAQAIPYPIAIESYRTVSYNEYLAEKDYVHHFYEATKQENVNYSEIDQQVLDQLIENKIIESEAQHYHIKVTNEDINTAINGIIDQNGGKDKVEKVLRDMYNLDLKSFRRLVKNQLLRDKVNQDLIMRVTARHILVRVAKDAPQDQVDAAKAKIDGYLTQIKNGADFGDLAKQYSEDTGSNEQGGELEPFAPGEMVPEFSKTAFSTPVGQISDPVRSEFGWHIIKVEAKQGTIDKSFTDWIAELKQNLAKKHMIAKLI